MFDVYFFCFWFDEELIVMKPTLVFDCLVLVFRFMFFDGCLDYWSFVPSFGWLKLDFLGLRRVGFSALRALMTRASPANQNYGTKLQYCAPPSLEQNRKTNSWQSKLTCKLPYSIALNSPLNLSIISVFSRIPSCVCFTR